MDQLNEDDEVAKEYGGVELPRSGDVDSEWNEDSEDENTELEDGSPPDHVEDEPQDA